jgi:anti-sigma B factor antagonist
MSDAAGVEQPVGDSVRFSVATEADGIGTVTVAGDVDLLTAPHLASALQQTQERKQAVLLDLSEVDFLGSAGLSVLVEAARRTDDSRGRLAVLVTRHAVRRAIEVTGLDAALHIFETTSEAEGYLKASHADD